MSELTATVLFKSMIYLKLLVVTVLVFTNRAACAESPSTHRCILRDNPTIPQIIREEYINDDYCDCQDGSDEPLTAACSGTLFTCLNKGYKSKQIPSGWLSDSYCDCCDGSDEPKDTCADTCNDLRRDAYIEAKRQADVIRKGLKQRDVYISQAKRKSSEDHRQLENLNKQLKVVSKALLLARKRIETLNAAREIHLEAQRSAQAVSPSQTTESHIDDSKESDRVVNDDSDVDTQEHLSTDHHETELKAVETGGEVNRERVGGEEGDIEDYPNTHQSPAADSDVQDASYDSESAKKSGDVEYGQDVDSGNDGMDDHGHDHEHDHEHERDHDHVDDDDIEEGEDDLEKYDIDDQERDEEDDHYDEEDDEDYDDFNEDDDHYSDMENVDSYDDSTEEQTSGDATPTVTLKAEELSEYAIDAICSEFESHGSNVFVRSVRYLRARALKMLHRTFHSFVRTSNKDSMGDIDSCIRQADDAKRKLESRKYELDRQISKLDRKDTIDYGPDEVMRALHGSCKKSKIMQYEFEHCPFDLVRQYEHGHAIAVLGRYDQIKNENNRTFMTYKDGDRCWNGPVRSIEVRLDCGSEEEIVSVDEPNRCAYSMVYKTPAVCEQSMADAILAEFESANEQGKEDL